MEKQNVCQHLSQVCGNKIPVILNQENFLLKANNFKIKQCLPDFHIIVNPAEKKGLNGRPKGGMFIAIPEHLKENVTDVSPGHWRLQACILKLNMTNILIVNSYFPCDPKTRAFNDAELLEVFATIDKILEECDFNQVVWGGDINCGWF